MPSPSTGCLRQPFARFHTIACGFWSLNGGTQPRTQSETVTVGELLRPANGHAMAMMSVASAERLVASARGRAGYDLVNVDDRRLGLVLGRALAHEIGHYLLDTHTHARHGLMRPQFNALEFTDLRDGNVLSRSNRFRVVEITPRSRPDFEPSRRAQTGSPTLGRIYFPIFRRMRGVRNQRS